MPQSTVLIVDDEPLGRATLEGLLRPLDYQLLFAANGPEALARTRECAPDVILLDVMMPGMDGFAVCRELRADAATAEVPILLITALDDRDSLLEGIAAGADDFISKPFDRAEVRMRVQTIARLNRYRQLVHSRERFAWVVEQAVEGYVVVDDADRITYANQRARRYLGLPNDPHTPIEPTFYECARALYRCEPQSAWSMRGGSGNARAERYLVMPESPGTAAFWLHVDILELPGVTANGQLMRLRDVTAQMALQRDLYSFHAMINHKLQTPLAGLLMSAELLGKHAQRLSAAQIADIAQTTYTSAKRLRTQIADIIQYVNLPTLAAAGEDIRVSRINSMVEVLATTLKIADITVACPLSLSEQHIGLSERALELILWEVCENSKKFHPRQAPQIDILLLNAPNDMLTMQIRDDGVTLMPQELMRVWQPYNQPEKNFTGQLPGMGLGLALVATLVWSAGGTCALENRTDGPGVLIELALPLRRTSPVASSTSPMDGGIMEHIQ